LPQTPAARSTQAADAPERIAQQIRLGLPKPRYVESPDRQGSAAAGPTVNGVAAASQHGAEPRQDRHRSDAAMIGSPARAPASAGRAYIFIDGNVSRVTARPSISNVPRMAGDGRKRLSSVDPAMDGPVQADQPEDLARKTCTASKAIQIVSHGPRRTRGVRLGNTPTHRPPTRPISQWRLAGTAPRSPTRRYPALGRYVGSLLRRRPAFSKDRTTIRTPIIATSDSPVGTTAEGVKWTLSGRRADRKRPLLHRPRRFRLRRNACR